MSCHGLIGLTSDKGKPDQSQGRKATDPQFLREAMDDSPEGSKTAIAFGGKWRSRWSLPITHPFSGSAINAPN